MTHLRHQSYRTEHTEMNYLYNTRKNSIIKIKKNVLELERDFEELKDRELRDREIKLRKEIEELFFKSINVSIDDMNKFEENEETKKRPFAKSTWYVWLISYSPAH